MSATMSATRPAGGALTRIREFFGRSPDTTGGWAGTSRRGFPATPASASQSASPASASPGAGRYPGGFGRVVRNGDDFRDAAGDLGIFLQQLGPALAQLGPALGEFSPLFPMLTSCSVRVAGALVPLAPVAQVTMPALAEYTGICTRQFIDLLPELGPLLYPVGQELGGVLVALGPLLAPTGELLVAATHLLVATVELAGGFAPMVAQALPAVTDSRAGALTGYVASGQNWAGLASRLRVLPLAGPADRALAGARISCRLRLISAAGSVSQLLPTVAPSVQAGAARLLIMILPAVPPAMTRIAAVITRLTPMLEPMVRGGAWVAVPIISRLAGFVAAVPDSPEAGARPSLAAGPELVGARTGRPGIGMTTRGRAGGAAGAAMPEQRVVPLISIVVYVNGQQ
jgi:hypothetical protein